MRKITNYGEFITESKLELLLEAKIKFSDEFITLLNHIESPLVKKILDHEGKDVDINRNYMTYDIDKENSVLFYPEDKAEKQGYRITDPGHSYVGLAQKAELDGTYPIKNVRKPEKDQEVTVIKKLTEEELQKILPNNLYTNAIVHISFEHEYMGTCEMFYNEKHLVRDISKLKPSDVLVGRFVNNFLTKAGVEFTPIELNDFIDKYKSEMKELKEKFKRFEIVKGEDIKFWYLVDRYEKQDSGSLGTSCMRHSRCQKYFDIYTDNDEVVSMIILKSRNDPDKIIGRAILWDATFINRSEPIEEPNIKFMDKIYVNDYSDENFFIKFARANGFYYKKSQDYSETPIMFDGKVLDDDESYMSVSINGGRYDYYPYMDTMKYYDDRGILTNCDSKSYDYTLQETEGGDGSCSTCGGSGEIECRNCGGDGQERCDDCYGDGSTECNDCEGEGKSDCNTCDGEGKSDCNTCDGEGKSDCGTCDGDGTDDDGEECSDCSGSGKKDCSDCDGEGKKDCSDCDGEGDIECSECSGSGDISCYSCDGVGEHECYRCEGTGEHDCPECN
jgi:hypothetical protein